METNQEEEILRILIVDDDADERNEFRRTLKQQQFTYIMHEASGCRALFIELEQHPRPHIIFMDINMPLPNGLECLQKLKEDKRYADIPVLMFSISEAQADIEKARAAGAHGYIVKPHAPANLPATLKKAFERDWKKPQPVLEGDDFVTHITFLP